MNPDLNGHIVPPAVCVSGSIRASIRSIDKPADTKDFLDCNNNRQIVILS